MFWVLININEFFFLILTLYFWILWANYDVSDLTYNVVFFILISFRVKLFRLFLVVTTVLRTDAFGWPRTSLMEGSSCVNRKFSISALWPTYRPFLWVIRFEWWGLTHEGTERLQSFCGQWTLEAWGSQPNKHQSLTASEMGCISR